MKMIDICQQGLCCSFWCTLSVQGLIYCDILYLSHCPLKLAPGPLEHLLLMWKWKIVDETTCKLTSRVIYVFFSLPHCAAEGVQCLDVSKVLIIWCRFQHYRG